MSKTEKNCTSSLPGSSFCHCSQSPNTSREGRKWQDSPPSRFTTPTPPGLSTPHPVQPVPPRLPPALYFSSFLPMSNWQHHAVTDTGMCSFAIAFIGLHLCQSGYGSHLLLFPQRQPLRISWIPVCVALPISGC